MVTRSIKVCPEKSSLAAVAAVTLLLCQWSCSASGGAGTMSGSGGTSSASGGSLGTGGTPISPGGSPGTGGAPAASGGSSGTGGTGTGGAETGGASSGGSSASGGSSGDGAGGAGTVSTAHFSFFVTSLESMRLLSKSQDGFGGDLRFGMADGLTGADEICRQVAEIGMTGAGTKQWRAFLSAVKGPSGVQVNAIDRVGEGPWYDRMGRLVAMTKTDLVQTRPRGADPAIINDLPNETGVPNRMDPSIDNHDTLTGSKADGTLASSTATCADWTNNASGGVAGKPQVGHSWPQSGSGLGWIQAHTAAGCAPSVNLVQTGGPTGDTVGSAGGYGGIYCLALTP